MKLKYFLLHSPDFLTQNHQFVGKYIVYRAFYYPIETAPHLHIVYYGKLWDIPGNHSGLTPRGVW